MAESQERIRLGDFLIKKGMIDQQQLDEALDFQKKHNVKLGEALIKLNYVPENRLLKLLSEQLNIPFIDLRFYPLKEELMRKLPEKHARRLEAIILDEKEDGYLVGVTEPLDLMAEDQLRTILKASVHLALVKEKELKQALDTHYQSTERIESYAEELSASLQQDQVEEASIERPDLPVAKILYSLFEDAIANKASDIHIEPESTVMRVRKRVDGLLHEQLFQDTKIAAPLTQRLKLMANLNIAEKKLPQDGSFTFTHHDEVVDVRLSTMPTQYGESVVMRLLRRSQAFFELEQLGLSEKNYKKIDRLLKAPYGMILTTGPTGSGKTSTLYSMLHAINKPESKIFTIEDPVEYRIARLNQVQVNPKVDLTFARVLRSVLRQDPDIVMVGELRDTETAQIGLRAALTGHLVFSTLHTNDSKSAATRLIDMEIPEYLVASALRAVLAQRLVRLICDNCKTKAKIDNDEKERFQILYPDAKGSFNSLKQGEGCQFCRYTGYSGRAAIFEILEITPELIDALQAKDYKQYNELVKKQLKGDFLVDNAWQLAQEGKTSLTEVLRIVSE